MIYFTADWHEGHENIIKYCKRPFKNFTHMGRVLLKNYNEVVTDDDTVYFIGDLTLRTSVYKNAIEQLVSKMNGQKHLILGNHDRLKPFDYVELGFITVHTALELPEYNMVLVHDPATSAIDRSKVFICGHVHDLFKTQKNVINVGVDVWDFKPVSIETLLRYVEGVEEYDCW